MVFVDTGGWIAVTIVSDSFHKVAKAYYVDLLSRRVRLFTSNYVLDETITRIRYDIGHAEACRFCDLYEQAEKRQLVTTLCVDENGRPGSVADLSQVLRPVFFAH